ncbi:MAG: threonine ammonia-lyase, biosynthetic [Thiomonas sp.]
MAAKHTEYLQRILNARVYDVAIESALDPARNLSRRLHNKVLFKREDTQPVFSFKLRGAYNKMSRLSEEERKRGVICASAGNHAQGVALAAHKLGCRAVIVMPATTPKVKIDAVRSFGGANVDVVLQGDSYSDAYAHALTLQDKQGLTFVHPFDDPDVIAGQGTIGMEILRQHQAPIHAVFCAIGGGGLISGVASYIKAVRPEIKVIGVQTVDSDAMLRSVQAGRRITLPEVGLFCDGTAVKQVGRETFRLVRGLVDDFVVVDTDAVSAAIKDVFEDTRSVLEPSGAMSVAALKAYAAQHKLKGETLIAVTCGANMNFDRLRFVAERAEVGEAREALYAVTIPERPGSFRRLCGMVGTRNVTEFTYRIKGPEAAHVFVGLTVNGREDAQKMAQTFERTGYGVLDLTDNELAKVHVRHLVGGPAPRSAKNRSMAENERLLRFGFPERPGALLRFLDALSPNWNISLFHYRNQGGDSGHVLVGIQVPPSDRREFSRFLQQLGYQYTEETDNPVTRLFLS